MFLININSHKTDFIIEAGLIVLALTDSFGNEESLWACMKEHLGADNLSDPCTWVSISLMYCVCACVYVLVFVPCF